ncbi:MAG TPA: aminotransferase [Desulfotomaculum sp.]|nr:MAG: Serine--glyoxylate transaminase [Desulfotomaculum sp. 46_296]HAG10074.1 aminotransferase [Desulfotomaculum sp.]HBY04478.1 aminotransferase [Desulfotomaculum sp.]
MKGKQYLMIPGPTPLPPAVTAAMSMPIIGHRSEDFANLLSVVAGKLKEVFQTKNDLFVLTNSGTGAMEAAVANVINPGDSVLALITGNFGERFANIAKAYSADVDEVNFEWGREVDLRVVEEKLASRSYKAVLATQNETSTGVINDIAGISALVSGTDALLMVDGVSGMGGIELKTDEWKVDIVVTASQKAFMLPPGLSMISVSDKAWKIIDQNTSPRFYFSLPAAKKSIAKWNTAYTPNVSLLFGLNAALDMMLEEGMKNVYERHLLLARAARAGVKALGLKLLAENRCASPTVTSAFAPEGYDVENLRKILRKQYGIVFAGGQGHLKGKIFRIAHMGYADKMDIIIALGGLEMALQQIGCKIEPGAGLRAAEKIFLGEEEVS